ncbi:hypothetical protein FBUS_01899 [Fasciolopsis buskii]|uniref:EF-hand domain-containing protein n=1 Tax=Fasciolopsis buskii TaxID=27845 RepID=A0A8E0RUK0_9TREM|nr:hypothetical protein FBUS_01899 [Fasciolopsis buski]
MIDPLILGIFSGSPLNTNQILTHSGVYSDMLPAEVVAKNLPKKNSKNEFRLLPNKLPFSQFSLEVRATFDELDEDKSGSITIEELKSKLEQMCGRPLKMSTVELFMKQYDKDGDKKWSPAELADFLRQNKE